MDIEWVDMPSRKTFSLMGRNAATLSFFPGRKAASAKLYLRTNRHLLAELGWAEGVALHRQISADRTLVRLSPADGGVRMMKTLSINLSLPWLMGAKTAQRSVVTHRVEGSALVIELPDWALAPSSAEEATC